MNDATTKTMLSVQEIAALCKDAGVSTKAFWVEATGGSGAAMPAHEARRLIRRMVSEK